MPALRKELPQNTRQEDATWAFPFHNLTYDLIVFAFSLSKNFVTSQKVRMSPSSSSGHELGSKLNRQTHVWLQAASLCMGFCLKVDEDTGS